ncbi:MAG: virginiamycin lyase, partial [Solirubrobacteraceae bacterium]|nr:virginiamycin lyase [Solirubrobacteraceae bacterium]
MHVRFDLISHRGCLVGLAGLLLAAPSARAGDFESPVFTEFVGGVAPGFSANGRPAGAALGPDGNVWFAETRAPGRIAKVTPAGTVTEFTGGVTPNLSAGHMLTSVARGPDGNLWFGDFTSDGGVVKITPGG